MQAVAINFLTPQDDDPFTSGIFSASSAGSPTAAMRFAEVADPTHFSRDRKQRTIQESIVPRMRRIKCARQSHPSNAS